MAIDKGTSQPKRSNVRGSRSHSDIDSDMGQCHTTMPDSLSGP